MSQPLRISLGLLLAAGLAFSAGWWWRGAAAPPMDADEREVLYWVAPMDASFRSDRPGKSPMGMDLVPVYADAADAAGPGIRIAPAVINNIGVRTAPVEVGTLHRNIDTVGYIRPDADRVAHVHVRTEGWIERLVADTEGDAVAEGDVLFEIYSPSLVSAQNEYLQALDSGRPGLVEAARRRLRALGMLGEQIETVQRTGSVRQRFEVRSPQNGFLMELNVREGMYVQPGNTIMSLADLAEVWVDVDVFEQQIDWVREGQTARMRLPFAPARVWHGQVEYIYPTIRPDSRTARVRLAFDNPDLALKPNMYAEVDLEAAPRTGVLNVPTQAVIRTGREDRVILALDGGRFRPAEVATGIESDGRTEIVEGLHPGERVVVSAQFLIDSEASLDASLLRMLGEPGQDPAAHHRGHGTAAPDEAPGGAAP